MQGNKNSSVKKVLFSGIQPSGRLHIGNYFGAMKQFIELQNEYESYISIVNYHALTTIHNAARLAEETQSAVIDHLAVGLDPKKVVFFLQSDVPHVTELAWVFNTLVTVSYLSRAHAYKDKVAQGIEATVGLFDYPMLMAADILLYGANVVPIGADQKQHVEIARDVAKKFNETFGATFTIPEALVRTDTAIVTGIDGRKMSKSYGNSIPIFAEDEEIEKLVMSIMTDSKGEREPKNPETCTVFALHKLFSRADISDIESRYLKGDIGYRESKQILIDTMRKFIAPLRDKRKEIAGDVQYLQSVLKDGKGRAEARAIPMMEAVRKKVGVSFEL